MKKLLSIIMSVAMVATMLTAFGVSVSAAEQSTMEIKAIFIDGKTSEGVTTYSKNPVISWEITKANSEQKQAKYSVVVQAPEGNLVLNSGIITSDNQSVVYNGSQLVNGKTYNVGITLTDEAGNKTLPSTQRFTYETGKEILPSDLLGNGTGDNNITMNGTTIPAPTYTVTIPTTIAFGNVSKKLKSVSDADAIVKTTPLDVTLSHSYLFDNQKNIIVTLSTDNKIKNGANEIAFDLYDSAITDTKITSGVALLTVKPASSLVDEVATKSIYATLDQRLIKASGDYTGSVTFTVALADNI